ncbi:MAG: hypothetical protein VKM17_12065 [Cyanobacteriota bacterium]|nr:hypothetical protein [Cyanobacteriota bacterium]
MTLVPISPEPFPLRNLAEVPRRVDRRVVAMAWMAPPTGVAAPKRTRQQPRG